MDVEMPTPISLLTINLLLKILSLEFMNKV